MITIHHLKKTYAETTAVNDISIHVSPGEVYGLIGANGAGKSTLIKSCCGLTAFDSGEILIAGNPITDAPMECKKVMAYIPDEPEVYPYLTGYEFLNFIADMYQISRKDREERINIYSSRLGMHEYLDKVAGSYSHGTKQKLVVISAFIHNPKIIFMDEPFVGLDPKAAFVVKQMMREKCEEGGAVFFSSHVLEVVEKLCDRIGIIQKGQLVKEGSVKDMVENTSLEEVFLSLEG